MSPEKESLSKSKWRRRSLSLGHGEGMTISLIKGSRAWHRFSQMEHPPKMIRLCRLSQGSTLNGQEEEGKRGINISTGNFLILLEHISVWQLTHPPRDILDFL